MRSVQNLFMGLLFLASCFMLLWGGAGFFEYFTGIIPIVSLQQAVYPSAVQFLHWLLITLFGGVFCFGYLSRWRYTPIATVMLFSNMALLCTIETIDFQPETWGVVPYLTELAFYAVGSAFLLLSPVSTERFVQ